jgi:lipopolysaccharide assembly protein B
MAQPNSFFSFLLVLVAIGFAWLAGYRSRFQRIPGLKRSPQQDYFIGLNYLLNDEQEDAIDVFMETLEINAGTLTTHLALCTLLRRRGEVDRSISRLEQLLTHAFSTREHSEIKVQLARSFIAAGLLDRAEKLLDELVSGPPAIREVALGLAISVFQKEKEWDKALAASAELLKICSPHLRQDFQLQASHFYCELAEMAMKVEVLDEARAHLKNAMQLCRHNVRVYLMQGRLESRAGASKEAVKALLKVGQFDPAFMHESAEELRTNLLKAGVDKNVSSFLEEEGVSSDSRAILDNVAGIEKQLGPEEAVNFLLPQLRAKPSLSLLSQLMALTVQGDSKRQSQVLELGSSLLNQYLHNSPHYRCENCGFELKSLHWLCPGCSRWGMVKPLDERISYHHENLTTPS